MMSSRQFIALNLSKLSIIRLKKTFEEAVIELPRYKHV